MNFRRKPVEHRHTHTPVQSSAFALAFTATMALVVVKLVAGVWAQSLALKADAVHSLGDVGALALAWYADRSRQRPPTHRLTFGWGRTEILVGLLNALALWGLAVTFVWQAWQAWHHPVPANPVIMAIAALISLVANGILAKRFVHSHDLNRQSTFWHLVSDAAGSLGVLAAAIILFFTKWQPINAVTTVAIALLMFWGAWGVVRDTISILLEAAPASLPMADIIKELERVPHVERVHDLHVWTIGSHQPALSCHVRLKNHTPLPPSQEILCDLHDILERWGIDHSTIQVETHEETHSEPSW